MKSIDGTTPPPKQKEGIIYKMMLGIASVIGIGWQVLLLIIRVLGIVVGIIAGVVIGLFALVAYPEGSAFLHWAAFLVPAILSIGAAELFRFFYPDPLEAYAY